jgi:hypothetical protein
MKFTSDKLSCFVPVIPSASSAVKNAFHSLPRLHYSNCRPRIVTNAINFIPVYD